MRTAVLSADLAWTTLCLGGFMPGTRAAMSAMTALLVALHFCDPRRGRAHPAGWLFLPFLAYAACNVAWVTPVPWLGAVDLLNWAQGIAVFWIVLNGIRSTECRRVLVLVIVALAVTSAAVGVYEHFVDPRWLMLGRTQLDQFVGRSAGTFGFPNSQGVLMALLIPPVAGISFRKGRIPAVRIGAVVALVALVTGFILAISRGAWLALAAAAALQTFLAPGQSAGRRFAGAGAVLAGAVAVVVVLYASFPLMHERMVEFVVDVGERTRPIMWRGAWGIFLAHPVFGGGAGCFDCLFESFRPVGFRGMPVYSHCDYLNTLCDYGLTGFVLFFGAAAMVLWRCAGARGLGAAAFTGLLAFALHLLVDFHLKIPALAMIVASIAAILTADTWREDPKPDRIGPAARAWGFCLAASTVVLVFAWIIPIYRAEGIRGAARGTIDEMAQTGADLTKDPATLSALRAELGRAVAMDPSNPQALADKAYADELWALIEPAQTHALGEAAESEAARAVALAPVVAEYWVREGAGLDMQGRWIEGGACCARALNLAPNRADMWYYRAYHLSLNPVESGPAMAAVNLSLRLDPGFLLAQALRQRLAH
jgi:hypothetical protein